MKSNTWFTPEEGMAFVRKLIAIRKQLIRTGKSQLPEPKTSADIDRLEKHVHGYNYTSYQSVAGLIVGNIDLLRNLIPGKANRAHENFHGALDALYQQATEITAFYRGDLNQVPYPFYLHNQQRYVTVKLCGPKLMVVISCMQLPQQGKNYKQTTTGYGLEDYRALLHEADWQPCSPALFRRALMHSMNNLLAMLDTSHSLAPDSDQEIDELLRRAVVASGINP